MKYPMHFAAALSAATMIAVPRTMAAPVNDNFASATVITASSGTSGGVNTATATLEQGEPVHASIPGGHSIWYRFAPTVKDRFTFNTSGSGFDTTLAAYTGTAVNALIELVSNDDVVSGTSSSRVEFTAGPAQPVMVAIDGYEGDSGPAALGWAPAIVTNNNFSAAKILTGNSGTMEGYNYRATSETGEPNTGNTVWYRWTAPATTSATVDVLSADMAPFVGIYTGTAVDVLSEAGTAAGPSGAHAAVTFDAVAGTVYRIQVKGNTGAFGDFSLSWSVGGGANLPLLPDLICLTSEDDDFMHGWYLDQTQQPGRTLLRLTSATANVGSGALELRGSSANPAVYQRIYKSDGTWTDRLAGTFTFHPSHGHLHIDDWHQFHLRAVTAGNGVGDIVASGDKTSFSIVDRQAHDLNLAGAAPNGIYTGGLVQGISVGWRDVYGADLTDQWIDVTSVPPGNYWLESVVDPDNNVQEVNETNNATRILVTYAGTAPPNDNFGDATELTGATTSASGRNFSATKENDEPAHAANAGGTSVWYRWTAPATAPAVIITEGSTFDTLLAVYTGSSVSGLTAVASNDNDGALTTSRVTFTAAAGTTYRIAVDGKNGVAGIVELAINPAQNDHFAEAIFLFGGSGTAAGSTRHSTAEPGEPAHAGSPAATSIWYSWTATMTGDAAFSTEGSLFDARLGIYTGSNVSALTRVASAVSNGFNSPATAIFHVNSGTVYSVAVDGAPGLVKLNWQVAASIAPYVITHPGSKNALQGTNADFAAVIGGSPLLSYQWKFGGNPVSNGDKYAGVDSPSLTVKNLELADSGAYTLTATNLSGAVTTNSANLVVVANPRIATVTDTSGDIGGSVFAPILLNASGDEHALQFTLVFDPAVLSNCQITVGPDAAGGAIALDRTMEASGKLGVILTLPGNTVFSAGQKNLFTARCDVAAGASANSNTVLAFGDQPVQRAALSSAAAVLPVVFDAGNITLEAVKAGITSTPAPGGSFTLTVRGLRGKTYQLFQSTDMITWNVVNTATVGPTGIITFNSPPGDSRAFFKAALAP